MKKVTAIYMLDKDEFKERSSQTGLILELEDGTMLQEQSTDIVMPYEPYKPKGETK